MTYDKMTDVERVARAIADPGKYVGFRGEKGISYWQAEAAIAALQSAAPVEDDVREEAERVAKRLKERMSSISVWYDGEERQLDKDAAALIERLSSTGGQGNG